MHQQWIKLCSLLGKWVWGMLAPSSERAVCVWWQAVLILWGVAQFVSHSQNLHFSQLLGENSCSLPKKTVYTRSLNSVNFRLYSQFSVNAGRKANIGSKYTFPHLKLEESEPYVPENQFISPKQINLYLQSELICHIHKTPLFVLILLAHLIFSSTPFPGQGRWSD